MICCIKNCEEECGTHVICRSCAKSFRRLPKSAQRKVWHKFHQTVFENFSQGEYGICHWCNKPFPRDQLCGDHVKTKGSSPELKFDTSNAVLACAVCNGNSNLRTTFSYE